MMVDHKEATERYIADQYVLGELSQTEREAFEEHFFTCLECAEDVRALMTFSANARSVLAETSAPAETARARNWKLSDWFSGFFSWRPRAVYALAPACLLLVSTVGTTYRLATLRSQIAPQAVAMSTLRPDSRGEEPVITASQLGPWIVLAADAPEVSGELKWQIRAAESRAVLMEGTTAPPSPGTPLTLLIPASRLSAGPYILSLGAQISPADSTNESVYRFRMH